MLRIKNLFTKQEITVVQRTNEGTEEGQNVIVVAVSLSILLSERLAMFGRRAEFRFN
jgi:hypothetical protein